MFRKSLFALAALATVSAAALAPTAASAKPWGKGWHHHHGYGLGLGLVGAAIVADAAYSSCWVKRWVDTPFGPRLRRIYVCY
jgi:hypothetical protein